jgi:small subunit ribosomal protein S29
MPVDMSLYGKIDYSGTHDDDPEPCPRVWDPVRKCWSDSWKEHLYDHEIKFLQQRFAEQEIRCSERLLHPKTMLELIDFGVNNPHLGTSCMGEVLL